MLCQFVRRDASLFDPQEEVFAVATRRVGRDFIDDEVFGMRF